MIRKMRETKKSKRNKRKRPNPFFVVIMGIVLMLVGNWSYELWKIDREMEREKASLTQKKLELMAQNEKLRQEIEKLNTPSYIEQLAREKLGLVRKGEIIIAPKKTEE